MTTSRFTRRRPNQAGVGSESMEQQSLITWWSAGGRVSLGLPDCATLLAIPNGGWRHPSTAARLRAEGVTPGIPDLFLAWPAKGGNAAGLWIEMKRADGGRLSPAQAQRMSDLELSGYSCCCAHGWQAAALAMSLYVSGSIVPRDMPWEPVSARHAGGNRHD